MSSFTNDQYHAFNKLNKWYDKYTKQFFEISGNIGTGIWEVIQAFLEYNEIDQRNVLYLSFDQKFTLSLALKGYHSYYIHNLLYKHEREIDLDSIPVLNPKSNRVDIKWKKKRRNKLPRKYEIIIIFDSLLMNQTLISDISSFGIPVILIKDDLLIPCSDSLCYLKESNVTLHTIADKFMNEPIIYFANKIKNKQKLIYGSFNGVNIIPKKQLSLYNLKSADMILTITNDLRNNINSFYRERILNVHDNRTILNEKIISRDYLWRGKVTDENNSKVKVFLVDGLIGYLTRVPRHALSTKFINVDIKPEFYHQSFEDIDINRFSLFNDNSITRQEIPDEFINLEYAYALPISLGRYSFWNKVTMIVEDNSLYDDEIYQRLLYTGITRARQQLTIVI